jgi:membrane-bound metal-dependent hydrolase YbcI (DUF457 family)
MFIGHYAVALAAKKVAPKVSLGTLFLSVQAADLVWPVLVLLGVEHVRVDPGNTAFTPLDFSHYPITHSLLGAAGWSILFGALYFFIRRYPRGAWIVGLGVFSHWALDFVVHRPDLQLVPWSVTRVGLGLWNSIPGTLALEIGMYLVGAAVYLRATAARDRVGRYALWTLLALLLIIYAGNAFGGQVPPSETAVAVLGLGTWLFVPWAYWIDRHRDMPAGP